MAERMVGRQAPGFEMDAVMPDKEFGKVRLSENMENDKWTVFFFLSNGLYVRMSDRNHGNV